MDKIWLIIQFLMLLASGLIGVTVIGLIWIKLMEWTSS